MELKTISIDMLSTFKCNPNEEIVTLLVKQFEQHDITGYILVRPRNSPIERYKVMQNIEILIAAQQLGETSVKCLIADWPDGIDQVSPWDTEFILSNLNEPNNHQANDAATHVPDIDKLSPLSKSHHYQQMIKKYGSQEKAGKALNVKRSAINNSIQLLKLSKRIQDSVENGEINESAARTIALCSEKKDQTALFLWYINSEKKPTIRELEIATKTISTNSGDFKAYKTLIKNFSSEFSERTGIRINFVPTGLGGWCALEITDAEQATLLLQQLINIKDSDNYKFSMRQTKHQVILRFKVSNVDELHSVLNKLKLDCH